MAKTRRKYKGNAVSTTIAAGLAAGASSATIGAATGWPTAGPFYAVVDPGLSTEEKIYVGTISGTSLSNITRGADDTTDQTHAAGCAIYPVFTAVDADEANELTSKYANRGSIVYQGATTFEELPKGTQGYPLVIGANDPSWAQLGATGIASGAVVEAKLGDGAVTADKIGAQAVTSAKLNTAVAGDGLAGGGGSALSVNVDDSTIEINSDTVRVKNAGVTADKLASDAVETAKIKDANVTTAKLADKAVTAAKLGVLTNTTAKTDGFTLALGDENTTILCNKGTAMTVTVPLNSSVAFAVGTQISFVQIGAGQVTFAGAVGVTLNSDNSKKKILVQYGVASLIKTGTDTWVLFGQLTA